MRKILVIIVVSVFCSGCSSYAFFMDSDPEGADLNIINDKKEVVYTGKTPVKVPSKYIPKGEYLVTLNKIGYEENIAFKGNSKYMKLKKMDLGKRKLEKKK